MKKLILILFILPFYAFGQFIPIVGEMVPNHPLDKYTLMDSKVIRGAFMVLPDTNFMLDYPLDNNLRGLPVERRDTGQLVYVRDIDKYYQLIGGIENEHWTEVTIGGSPTLYLNTNRPTNYAGDDINLGNPNMRLDSAISLLLYAESPPTASISGDVSSPIENGQAASVDLSWSVVKNGTTDIDGIVVAGETITPTGNNQSGVKNVTATGNITYSINVTAGELSASDNTSYSFLNRLYIGLLSGYGDPYDTPFQEPNGDPASLYYQLTDVQIINPAIFPYRELKSGYFSGYQELSNTSPPARLVIIAPESFGEPEVSVDGVFYSSTVLQKKWNFVNEHSYSESYQMWVLYTGQGAITFRFYLRKK